MVGPRETYVPRFPGMGLLSRGEVLGIVGSNTSQKFLGEMQRRRPVKRPANRNPQTNTLAGRHRKPQGCFLSGSCRRKDVFRWWNMSDSSLSEGDGLVVLEKLRNEFLNDSTAQMICLLPK